MTHKIMFRGYYTIFLFFLLQKRFFNMINLKNAPHCALPETDAGVEQRIDEIGGEIHELIH